MIRSAFRRRLLSLALVLAASTGFAHAQYVANQNANFVWGQSNFTTGTAATPPSIGSLNNPNGICVDPKTGKYFVADKANNRVLRYLSAAAFLNGAGAEAVFGQVGFATKLTGNLAGEMNGPTGVIVDASGTLWVADSGNNRVLKFSGAANAVNDGTDAIEADVVLGQADFGFSGATTTNAGMNNPSGLAIDASGTLYVADTTNNRVLEFKNPNNKANNGLADGVIGQTNFNSSTPGTTNSTLNRPQGVAVDSTGNLWVSDTQNSRVVFFPTIASLPVQGASATLVLGQANFTTNTPGTTATTLNGPSQICLDSQGRLYVADSFNNRVVVYENPSTRGSGATANFAIGQPNLSSATAGTTQNTLTFPVGVVFSQNLIFITDATNNRMVNFAIVPGRPAFSFPGNHTLNPKNTVTRTIKLNNNSGGDDQFKVQAKVPADLKKLAKVTFTDSTGANITSKLVNGNYITPLFGPNTGKTSLSIKAKFSPTTAALDGGKFTITFQAKSVTAPSISTQKNYNAKFKKVN